MLVLYMAQLERSGDEAAFLAFYREYLPLLTRCARRYLPGGGLLDDALQESWMDIARDFVKISALPRHELPPYLATVIRHNCIDLLRRERNHAPLPEQVSSAADETLSAVLRRDALSVAAACIRMMPEIYRTVLERRLLLERSNKETARDLGISEALAAKRFERGLKLLREALKQGGGGE